MNGIKKYILTVLTIFGITTCFAVKPAIIQTEATFTPDTAFFDEEGNKVYLDQFEGKTVLLVFWATWCGSCISEMPSLDVLAKDFRKLPFEIIAVSQDFQGISVAQKYFTEQEIRHLKIYHDYQNQLFKAMEVHGMPTAFLISPGGKVKIVLKGTIKWHDNKIRDIILGEIAGNPEMPRNTYKTSSLNQQISPKNTHTVKETKDKENENKK